MALNDPNNTIAYHQSRILTSQVDRSMVRCANVANMVRNTKMGQNHARPEQDALTFYGLNHAVSLVTATYAPLEPLPQDALFLINQYHQQNTGRAIRAFYYLLVICIREFRHNKSIGTFIAKAKVLFGSECGAWFEQGGMTGEEGIHQRFLTAAPQCTIGEFVDAIKWGFDNSTWSGGYGGKAWGNVASCLSRYVHGEFSAEMMLDTVWTLCHNNGPIFNKHHFYKTYTPNLIRILDIQRSGQIPEAILTQDKGCKDFVDGDLFDMMKLVNKSFPGAIGKFVDWNKVTLLGAVQEYPFEISQQHQTHGVSPEVAKIKAQQKAKLEADMIAQQIAKQKAAKSQFAVMPDVFVSKVFRTEAA